MKKNGANINEDPKTQAHPALAALRNMEVQPSPYLASRTLAHYQTKSSNRKNILSFFLGSLASAAVAVVVFVFLQAPTSKNMEVAKFPLDQAFLVKVDIKGMSGKKVAYAKVEILGDSFQFFSKSHPELLEQSNLIVEWEQISGKEYLPVVIRGIKAGEGKMTVNFYDDQDRKIDSQVLPVSFGASI